MAAKSDQRKQKKTKALPQLNTHSGPKTGSRSSRRNQWTEFYDDDDVDEQCCEVLDEESQMKNDFQGQWDEIYQAIDENNADLLYALLPPVNLLNTKENYWSGNFYWRSHITGGGILRRAVELEHVDCVDVILEKVRSEELPWYIIDHGHWRSSDNPLLIACEKGNLKIVEMLLERSRANLYRFAAFFVAFEQGNETLMSYFISRYSLRTSQHHGRTAFDCLISRGYIEMAERLIRYGDVKRNNDGFSPMMLAVHHDLSSLVDLLFQRLPLEEALDELTLLACHYTINGDVQKREKAFDLFVRGLNEEELTETDIPHEIYENRHECKTIAALEAIRNDENALRMHSLIVSERILLRLGDVNPLVNLIDRQCNFYRTNRLFHRSLQLRIHARHLLRQYSLDRNYGYSWHDCYFEELIRDVDRAWNENKALSIQLIEIVSTNLLDDNDKTFVLSHIFDLLETIVHMIQSTTTNNDECRLLFNIARRAMKYDTIGNSLLVRYIVSHSSGWLNHDFPLYNVTPLSVIELMIQCGANVNGINDGWNIIRPLHAIVLHYNIDIVKPIIELLLAYGAHVDYMDGQGKFLQDLAYDPAIKELLSPTRNLSLKCRCAQIIISKRINYQHCLSPNLLAFVQLHTNQ